MPLTKSITVLFVFCCTTLTGCFRDRVDLLQDNGIKTDAASTSSLSVESPAVWGENGSTVVTGRVIREPNAPAIGTGHTHVLITLPNGIHEEQWVPWSQAYIPFRPEGHVTYRASFPWTAAEGTKVKVWTCFESHPNIPGGSPPSLTGGESTTASMGTNG